MTTDVRLGPTPAGASAFVLLASKNLSVAAASVDFTGIPATGSVLKLYAMCASDANVLNDNIDMQFNGDVGNNYDYQILGAGGGAGTFGANTGLTSAVIGNAPGVMSPAFAAAVLEITVPFYANTTFTKYAETVSGFPLGAGTNYSYCIAARWAERAAIDEIKLHLDSGGNFLAGSQFALYLIT